MSNYQVPVPVITLNNGNTMPGVGVGCWMGAPGQAEETYQAVSKALKVGYRHIDTAAMYGNEEAVGRAIRDSGIPREDLFVVTKLNVQHHANVAEGFELSLEALDIGYIDLYLMHTPQGINPTTGQIAGPEESPTYVETWKAMEKLLDTGKVKNLGISNFTIKNLEVLLSQATIIPVTNQMELHPSLPSFKLLEYCKTKNIVLTAYTPMGRKEAAWWTDEYFLSIAEAYKTTVGQLLVSWAVQRGTVPIPASTNEERLKNNLTLLRLSEEDMKKIDEYHKKPGMHRTLRFAGEHPMRQGKIFLGWPLEALGVNWDEDGFVIEE